MKKYLFGVLLCISCFNSFAEKILEIPYILSQKKLGNHGYCFVGKTNKKLAQNGTFIKKLIICYTDLELNLIKKTEVELNRRYPAEFISIQFSDSIFSVIASTYSVWGTSIRSSNFFFRISDGEKIVENYKTDKNKVAYYTSLTSENNRKSGYIEAVCKDKEESAILVSFINSSQKKEWTTEIQDLKLSNFEICTGNCYGNKLYISYNANFKNDSSKTEKEIKYFISIVDLENGKILNTNSFKQQITSEVSFVSNDSVYVHYGELRNYKNIENDVLIKKGMAYFELDEPNNLKTKKIGNLSASNFFALFSNPKVKISKFDDYLNYGWIKRELKNFYNFNNTIFTASVFGYKLEDENILFLIQSINTSNWEVETTRKFFSTPTSMKRKGWYNFYGPFSQSSSYIFNSNCNKPEYKLMVKSDSDEVYFVVPDWKSADFLPNVIANNLTTNKTKTINWVPSFIRKYSKVVQANFIEGVNDSILLYEIDKHGKAHFHFESMNN